MNAPLAEMARESESPNPPPSLVSKMLSNVLVDVILGGIPLVGPLADIWWRANDKNAALMKEFLASKA